MIKKFKRQTINQGVRICIDCGSILTLVDNTKLKCKECGATKKINKQQITINTNFLQNIGNEIITNFDEQILYLIRD